MFLSFWRVFLWSCIQHFIVQFFPFPFVWPLLNEVTFPWQFRDTSMTGHIFLSMARWFRCEVGNMINQINTLSFGKLFSLWCVTNYCNKFFEKTKWTFQFFRECKQPLDVLYCEELEFLSNYSTFNQGMGCRAFYAALIPTSLWVSVEHIQKLLNTFYQMKMSWFMKILELKYFGQF